MIINSKFLNGMKAPDQSIIETIKIIEKKYWKKTINFRLKDWEYQDRDIGVSAQWLMTKMEMYIQCQRTASNKITRKYKFKS